MKLFPHARLFAANLFIGNAIGVFSLQARNFTPTGCCRILGDAGLKNIYLPGTTIYTEEVESYWSITAQQRPQCFVQPENTEDVSKAVKVLVQQTECRFAVRSGGHSSNAGANNIDDGVTIDLSLLNSTTYDNTTSIASVSPGARWMSVYNTLDPLGIGVAGGRIGIVGVGGLLLGGGCSHYLARHGLATDNIVGFEVVLADGSVVEATTDENPDLYVALKGGGAGQSGIVTRFDLEAFPAVPFWTYGATYHGTDDGINGVQIAALKQWIDGLEDYQDGAAVVFWMYSLALGEITIRQSLIDTTGQVAPPPFQKFLSIPGETSANAAMRNMSEIALTIQSPGYRNIWFSATFWNDERMLAKAVELHEVLVEEILTVIPDGDFETQCFFQPLPAVVGRKGTERGGNILGIDKFDRNAVVLLGSLAVRNMELEAIGRVKMMAWKDALEEYGRSLGLNSGYIYMNYADGSQDVLNSYGAENVQKMRDVSQKYDPKKVFQTRVSGPFKLLTNDTGDF